MKNSRSSANQYLITLMNNYEPRYSSFFHNNPDGMFCLSLDGIFVDANGALLEFSGYGQDELIKKPLSDLLSPQSLNEVSTTLSSVEDGSVKRIETTLLHKKGHFLFAELTAIPIVINRKIVGVHGIIRDISEQKMIQRSIDEFAFYDPLTKLPNRDSFTKKLQAEFNTYNRESEMLALLLVNIDRFKVINDTCGHEVGDHVLKILAQRLHSCIRSGDIVARLAGDEFVIVAKRNSKQEIEELSKVIQQKVPQVIHTEHHPCYISISTGISLASDSLEDPELMIRYAGIALQNAKHSANTKTQFFSSQMGVEALRRLEIESALKEALAKSEFLLHYQPQIDLDLRRIIGVEALVRWNHPELGMIAPLEFIPLAEETGLIIPLGEWILTAACQQFRIWLDQGSTLTRLSINISVSQFNQDNFCELIIGVLEETGLDPSYLELEITESQLLNFDCVINKIQRLRAKGIKIAIDDFGTGYSPLSHLRQIAIDTLKIDKGFIKEICQNSRDKIIVQTIIQMAKMMKLNLIAEGVETLDQLDLLGEHQLKEVQGFYFSPPLPNSEFEKLLAQPI